MKLIQGCIDVIQGRLLTGWIIAPTRPVRPVVFVDGQAAECLGADLPRPDVAEVLGINDNTGFLFKLPRTDPASVISLYGITKDTVQFVCKTSLGTRVCEENFLHQVAHVKTLPEETVAIVCWDGAHNPIGRAKVLYDIIRQSRPAVLLCYLHREFTAEGQGTRLWPPLVNEDINLISIPWELREACHTVLQRAGISFSTIWISKPRLPSFLLASVVARPTSRILLDIDDDESAIIRDQKDRRAYNAPGQGLAEALTEAISARTVASPPLQARFGGEIVRHARAIFPKISRSEQSTETKKIAFLGTVRQHKNLTPLARAIRITAHTAGLSLAFHVLGDIQVPEERAELEANGAITGSYVHLKNLPETLASMDVLITGFPSDSSIAESQVPAKLFDALAAGRPVLVPETPAIADLKNHPGIYPFTLDTFASQLLRALHHTTPITLPSDATLEGAYKAFARAEANARPVPELLDWFPRSQNHIGKSKALLLLWKQYDAGFYGRRIDQIARSYHRAYPKRRVIVVEFVPEQALSRESNESLDFLDGTSEVGRLQTLLAKKRRGYTRDGISYYALSRPDEFFPFVVEHNLLPETTRVVLFPILQDLNSLADILAAYSPVIDVVDNQMSWAKDDARKIFVLEQYLRLMHSATTVLFNCEATRAYFDSLHFLDKVKNVAVIPNWYTLPEGYALQQQHRTTAQLNLIYTGNMNDRLDWALLERLAEFPDCRLHLAGTATAVPEKLDRLLSHPRVCYHGVTQERETLDLLLRMDVAIVPHVLDSVSRYMDPIKLQMYKTVGLPILCPKIIAPTEEGIFAYTDAESCEDNLRTILQMIQKKSFRPRPCQKNAEAAYLRLLD